MRLNRFELSGILLLLALSVARCGPGLFTAKSYGYGYQNGYGCQSPNDPNCNQNGNWQEPPLGIAGGSGFACAMGRYTVRCWGRNNYGQLGQGTVIDVGHGNGSNPMSSLVPIASPGIQSFGAGGDSVCMIRGGSVSCWGNNASGQLGQDDTLQRGDTPSSLPMSIAPVNLGNRGAKQVSLGLYSACALTMDGSVICWGYNFDGEAGINASTGTIGSTGLYTNNAMSMKYATPVNFGAPWGTIGSKQVSVGGMHACAILSDGNLKCWGANNFGQLGQDDMVGYGQNGANGVDTEGVIAFTGSNGGQGAARTVTKVSAGFEHTCAILSDGKAVCWGRGAEGELGQAGTGNISSTVSNRLITTWDMEFYDAGQSVTDISAGFNHTCALLGSGSVVCFGMNNYGQLGLGIPDASAAAGSGKYPSLSSVPPVPLGQSAIAVYAGTYFSCAMLVDRSIKCWGFGGTGQLGQDAPTGYGLSPGDLNNISPLQFFPGPPGPPPPGP